MRRRLRETLVNEHSHPGQALRVYDVLEGENRLPTWPLALLVFASASIATLAMVFVVAQGFEPVIPISFIVTIGVMSVPVFACLSRESKVLGINLSRRAVAGRSILGGFQAVFLDWLALIGVLINIFVLVIPIQLLLGALLHFMIGTPFLPTSQSQPLIYLPTFAALAFGSLCWVTNTETETFLVLPHRVAAELVVAIRHKPWAPLGYGVFFGGSLLLGETVLEVPFEGFAACLPAMFLIFRDGLPGRDPELSHLIRLGQIRAALVLGGPGSPHRLWYIGQAKWQHERLLIELDREQWLVRRPEDWIARNAEDIKERAAPLIDLGYGVDSGYVDQVIEDLEHEVNERRSQLDTQPQRQGAYHDEWLLSAESTLRLFLDRQRYELPVSSVNPSSS